MVKVLHPAGLFFTLILGMEYHRSAVLKINPLNGELSATPQSVRVASPVCVLFATKPSVDAR